MRVGGDEIRTEGEGDTVTVCAITTRIVTATGCPSYQRPSPCSPASNVIVAGSVSRTRMF